jgi:hypothetical protein
MVQLYSLNIEEHVFSIKNEIFQVSETSLPNTDRYGFIRSLESRLTFRVDDKLLTRLQKYNINTNPSNGVIRLVRSYCI